MRGIQHLLLLAEFVLLARCQQKPQVYISPTLTQIFSGDLIFLHCDNSSSESKWYFNNKEQTHTGAIWKIEIAEPQQSGSYQCERNREKSDAFPIKVLDYAPSASLSIKTGQPVVRTGGSVVLQLDSDDGLQGWKCWVRRKGPTKKIVLRWTGNSTSVVFQPRRLQDPETIFWCTDTQLRRSNQIVVRTSEKAVSLEMYPMPAVVGESLTLKCLAWGTDQISKTIFYKENEVILEGLSSTYKIPSVTKTAKGIYKCHATFTYQRHAAGPQYQVVSDNQNVFVQVPHMKAVLTATVAMSCSCLHCPSDSTYQWYYKEYEDQPWAHMDYSEASMMPKASGTYACRSVWKTGRSLISDGHLYEPPIKSILIGVVIVLVILIVAAVFSYIFYKNRNTTAPIYEDVPLRSRDKGDDKYEVLQMGARTVGDYDVLQPVAPARQKKEGDYEALKKEEMTQGVYHSLKLEEAAGGE